MTHQLGTKANPLRVAIIGAGPTGFYTAEHFFKQPNLNVEVDMFDSLPTPFGLVRGGVAPDHQNIKKVTKTFDKIAKNSNFRFYGYVEFGRDVNLQGLSDYYHQIIFATGAHTDRRMGIPGEDLAGSHTATDFIAWYNGHPDYTDYQFDLSHEIAVVVGIGNVALDVARMLCHTPEFLARTDTADYAIEALSNSNIKEVYVLGRRGPAQAAFSNIEIKEFDKVDNLDIVILPEEAELDPLSKEMHEKSKDRDKIKNVKIVQRYAANKPAGKARKLTMRFLISPVELIGNDEGQVTAIRLVKNELYLTENGTLRPKHTDEYEEIPVSLVFRSVGYRGSPLPDVPFYDKWGVILNEKGRVIDPETKQHRTGQYTGGWIKRGANGVIGTNRPDAVETVKCMLEDLEQGETLSPSKPGVAEAEQFIRQCQPNYFSYADWQRIDELEVARGRETDRPRVKFTSIEDMLAALDR